jgi:hypothetical protein
MASRKLRALILTPPCRAILHLEFESVPKHGHGPPQLQNHPVGGELSTKLNFIGCSS